MKKSKKLAVGGKQLVVLPALTWAEERNLKQCPEKKWFSWSQVIFVSRPDYSLGRLVDKGYLEMKIKEGDRYYRRVKLKKCQCGDVNCVSSGQ